MNATLQVSSSTVLEFTMDTCCPRVNGVSIETRQPLAFTVVVLVSSSNAFPLLVPRTITAICMCTRWVRRNLLYCWADGIGAGSFPFVIQFSPGTSHPM